METETASIRTDRVLRFEGGALASRQDRISVEEPLEIRVGGTTLAVTMRTPGHDFELAAGWLVTEGIVRRPEEIVRIEHCREVRSPEEEGNVVLVRTTEPAGAHLDRARRLLMTSSSCGLCGKGSIESIRGQFPPVDSPARTEISVVRGLQEKLRGAQAEFAQTGGLHAAGVFSLSGDLIVCREDIGRHNAVDKVIGSLFRQNRLPLSDSILFVSGRASFEIVQKALAAGIPIVVSVSAPSSLAIDLARSSGMALAGFLRGDGFNLYSGEDRFSATSSARESRE
jgi:FdhD protein